jgi:hypothetical protein
MNTESIKQRLIAELNENSMLLYAERQKFKENDIPQDLINTMRKKYQKQKKLSMIGFGVLGAFIILSLSLLTISEKPHYILQNIAMQFTPILGILYFSAHNQNLGKKIFILDLLSDWEN